ncbi:ATP-binding protein [Parerythrobacter aurantius]|uniref:sensor histidine kinase n=1 Tax=Parerythrobacter aurantius TaxID=3127706 RepID=UPI00324860CD
MMKRLRLPRVRVILVALSFLALIQLGLAMAAFWQATRNADRGFAFPVPERLVAIVEAVDNSSQEQLPALLAAVSDDRLRISVEPREAIMTDLDNGRSMPGVAQVIERYVERLGDREVYSWIAVEPGERAVVPRLETTRLYSRHPLRMAVSLADGRWLVAETRGDLARTMFGFPPGLWAGVFGVTVALLSLLLLWQSLSPLPAIAVRIRAFAQDQQPRSIPRNGPAEVREIAAEVEAMQQELANLLADRLTMLAALAHDLRTYLTRLRLRAETLADSEQRERMVADLESMRALSESALEFAQLGSQPVHPMTVEIGPLVRDIAERSGIPVDGSERSGLAAVIDPHLFERALENLIANAAKHGGGGRIELSAGSDEVRVDVLDDGPGFPFGNTSMDQLVAPFTRGDAARTLDISGTGLGLAIVKRSIELMGGRLAIANRADGGARVSLFVRQNYIGVASPSAHN